MVKPRVMVLLLAVVPAGARGQASPDAVRLGCDLKNAPVGSWADYTIRTGADTVTARWAFLGRDAKGNTLELTMTGGPPPQKQLGPILTRFVLVPEPVGVSRPIKQMVMQIGDRAPMELNPDQPGLPGMKFQNPDPKTLVGRETITVPAGTFQTRHFRERWAESTVDSWLSDEVPPLGLVRTTITPTPGTPGPGGKPMPPVTQELTARGQGARPTLTRAAAPYPPPQGKR